MIDTICQYANKIMSAATPWLVGTAAGFFLLNYIDDPEDHASSPGKLWASVGPLNMLGYNHTAPQDETGAPSMIVNKWLQLRTLHGDVAAWMSANDNRRGRNACTIQRIDESHVQYGYFKRKKGYLYNSYVLTNVIERITQ